MDLKNMRIATLHSVEKDLAEGTMKDPQDLLDDFLQKKGLFQNTAIILGRIWYQHPRLLFMRRCCGMPLWGTLICYWSKVTSK